VFCRIKQGYKVTKKMMFCGGSLISLFSGAMSVSGVSGRANPDLQYNVMLIAMDDLNDWVEPLGGNSQAITPNLERLSKMGMSFVNAHCAIAICTPSRNSLLLGRHPIRLGFNAPKDVDRICHEETGLGEFLPEHFKRCGYETYGAGKIFHEGFRDNKQVPLSSLWTEWGMDHNYGPFFPFQKSNGEWIKAGFARPVVGAVWSHEIVPSDFKRTDCWGLSAYPDGKISDEAVTDWAVDKLKRHSGEKPFFMECGLVASHVPLVCPKEYFNLYDPEQIQIPEVPDNEMTDVPPIGKLFAWQQEPTFDDLRHFIKDEWRVGDEINDAYWKRMVHAYLACTSFSDHQVGRLLDALEQTPDPRDPHRMLIDTTILVLFSDHGWHLGEKKHWNKQSLWEEATRVPFVWCVPGVIRKEAVSREPVTLLDIYPTLNNLCGLPTVGNLDGINLSGLLADSDQTLSRKGVVSTYYLNSHSVRSRDWRLIWYGDATMELYDHRTDPGEHTNLVYTAAGAEKYRDVVEEHLEVLRRYQSTEVDPARISSFKWQCKKYWGHANPPDWLE
jgi:iduronate 2-sulfatase